MNENGIHDIEQYTACVIFYSTDLAYNRIKDLERFIATHDRETKRIWWALYKRYKNYFCESNKCQGDGVAFIAHFSEIMDEKVDACLDGLKTYIEKELKDRNIRDADFIAALEIARIATQFAVNITDSMINIMNEKGIRTQLHEIFDLKNTLKVITNFYEWVTRHVADQQIGIGQNGELLESIRTLYKSIMEYDNFVEAYQYALKEDKKYGSKD